MIKKITFIIICFCLFGSLSAKEPIIATLRSVLSNEVQKFSIGKYSFYCEPYGVMTLEKLYSSSKLDSNCQNSIKSFYEKNPILQYFSSNLFEVEQGYHIEFRDNQCLIYAKGEMSLTELLLQEGLAVRKPFFRDEEFEYSFFQAQLKAKLEKKGMWAEGVIKNCISELYKN